MSVEFPAPGSSPRRAQALVFLIEQEAARTRDVRDATVLTAMPGDIPIDLGSLLDSTALDLPLPTGDSLHDLAGYGLARRPSDEVDGKALERTAPVWRPLVPESPQMRAQALLMLLRRHRVVKSASPHLREALGADTPAVVQAFEALGEGTLDSHYAEPSGFQKFAAKFRR